MLLNNKPKRTKSDTLTYIHIEAEVTPEDFTAKKINNYKL